MSASAATALAPRHDLYLSGWAPVGVRKSWDRCSMEPASTARYLGEIHTMQKSDLLEAVAWFTDEGALKVLVADYANGKRLTYRQSGRNWKLSAQRMAPNVAPQEPTDRDHEERLASSAGGPSSTPLPEPPK